MTAELFDGPVNYRDRAGAWQAIDNRFVPSTAPGFVVENAANSFQVRFREQPSSEFSEFTVAGGSYTLGLAGVDAAASSLTQPLAGRVDYESVLPGVDLQYRLAGDGLKESVVLRDASAPDSYVFLLSPRDGQQLSARRQDDGSWGFFASDGKDSVFTLAPPDVLEAQMPRTPPQCVEQPTGPPACSGGPANGEPPPGTVVPALPAGSDPPLATVSRPGVASLDVSSVGNGFRVELKLDSTWLRSSDRVFPVVVDPSLILTPESSHDATFMTDCVGTSSACLPDTTSDHVKVGGDGVHTYVAAEQFDLSAIPPSSKVISSTLNANFDSCFPYAGYSPAGTGCTWVWPYQMLSVDAHRISTAWSSSTHSQDLGIDSGVLAAIPMYLSYFGYSAGAWLSWDVTLQTQKWISQVPGQENYGIALEGSAMCGSWGSQCGLTFPDSRFATAALRPHLDVTYKPTLGIDSSRPMWSNGPIAVNEASGNLVISLPGPSFPTSAGSLSVPIVYNSFDTLDAVAGHPLRSGWTIEPSSWLEVPATGAGIDRVFSDRSLVSYSQVGTSTVYRDNDTFQSQLTKNGDGSFTVVDADGTVTTYGAMSGTRALLQSIASLSSVGGSSEIDYSYESTGNHRPLSVEAKDGGTSVGAVNVTWGCSGGILCITGPDGVVWKYSADSNGRPSIVTRGSRDLLEITYDSAGRPQYIYNADDLDPTHASAGYDTAHRSEIAYDGTSPGRVTSVSEVHISGQSPTTSTWSFGYNPDPTGATTADATAAAHDGIPTGTHRVAGGKTTITPPCQQAPGTCSGHSGTVATTVFYDDLGRTMERVELPGTDGTAHHTQVQYSPQGQLLWGEDEAGAPTDYTYDAVDGTLLSTSRPNPAGGGPVVTTNNYDETVMGGVSGSTYTPGTSLHGLQAYYYKTVNLLNLAGTGRPDAAMTDISSGTASFSWGATGPPALSGTTTNYSVRFVGDLIVPTGLTPTLEFRTIAEGGAQFVIDSLPLITHLTDTGQNTVTGYGAVSLVAGKHRIVLEYVEPTASPNSNLTLQYQCDAGCGSLATTFTAVPASMLSPAWSNVTSAVSPSGRVAFRHYADQWTGQPDYSLVKAPVNGTTASLITSYSYDSNGRLTGKVMPSGNASASISGTGDLTGAGTASTSNYGTVRTYYAAADTEPTGASCSIHGTYPQLGLLKSVTQHGLHAITYVYDAAGRPALVTNGAGTQTTCYDADGRVVSDKAPGDSQPTTYTYDPAGLVLTASHSGTADSTVGTISDTYDEAGRAIDVVDANGAEQNVSYDADGNPLTRVAAAGLLASSTNYTTAYSYNNADQLDAETDPAGRSYSFFYDPRGDLHGTLYPNGTYSWSDINALGEQTSLVNRHGSISSSTTTGTIPADTSPISEFGYQYNADGQKTQEQVTGLGSTWSPTGTLATASGNEITDAVRTTATSGDGRPTPDSSFGLWKPTTNLIPNGGFESGSAGWVGITSTFGSAAGNYKFGGHELYMHQSTAGAYGVSAYQSNGTTRIAATAGLPYTFSVWVTTESGYGDIKARVGMNFYNSGGTLLSGSFGTQQTVTTAAGWTRLAITGTAPSGTASVTPVVDTDGTAAHAFDIDGAQLEQSTLPTPYVETNGASASRSGTDVRLSSSLIDPNQGWLAFRLRPSVASADINTSESLQAQAIFEYWNGGAPALGLFLQQDALFAYRTGGSGTTAVNITGKTWSAGQAISVVMAWDATSYKVSFNGGAFQSFNEPNTITTPPSSFTLGYSTGVGGASRYLDGEMLWAAGGKGTLTDADAAQLDTLGAADATSGIPGNATVAWPANTSTTSLSSPTTATYTYDSIGRLSQAGLADGTCRQYLFDHDSNRTETKTASSGCGGSFTTASTYAYNPATTAGVDQLTSVTTGATTASYGYTADGEVSTRGSDTLTWDGLGRNTGGTYGSTVLSYTYDPAGAMSSRVTAAPSKTSKYLLGGQFETDGSGTVTTTYVSGPGGALASFDGPPTTGSTVTYLYYNGHGDLAAEADGSGNTTSTHTYDPFGGPNDPLPANAASHRYAGAWDKQDDSASTLILMGARPYDPKLGRFLAVDPVDGGSLNNYDYAAQDPINSYDLDGAMINDQADLGAGLGLNNVRPEDNCPTRACDDHTGNKTVLPGGITATVETVWKYSPKNEREAFEVYSFAIETPLVAGVFAGGTVALIASCPAMIGAAGPFGAAGCVVSVAVAGGATAFVVAFDVKEVKLYLREKRSHR